MLGTDAGEPATVAALSSSGAEGIGEFEAELRPLLGPALRLAAAMRLDPQDAEDAVQEAALRAWRRRGNRHEGTALRPWFLAIVANQCRETRRGRWFSVLRGEPQAAAPVSGGTDPAATIDVVDALRRLSGPTRLAVALRFYLDLPFEEVAAVAGCSVEAAKSRVRRGVAELAAVLRPEEATA
ncbi:MAG TPA: RNA polymerase sigma factor [Candidatus Dormibacteraeota bacterium]|nr:RNA polymerase sigma factor [Candidatus Dormibacteraeota bacterium]